MKADPCQHCLDRRLDARAARRQRLVDELVGLGMSPDELADASLEEMWDARWRLRDHRAGR